MTRLPTSVRTPIRGRPPGRAGRIWLDRRLATAQRGAALLEQKVRILHREEASAELLAARTEAAWRSAAAELDLWVLRAALLGGERAIRLAGDGGAAEVEISWRTTMGVLHPDRGTTRLPGRSVSAAVPDSSALILARAAADRAVVAAVDHAVADAALQALRTEAAATRRRLRAVQDRWIPRLEGERTRVQLALDEQEHDDGVRLRLAGAAEEGRRRP